MARRNSKNMVVRPAAAAAVASRSKKPRLDVQGFIDQANAEYETVHKAFEDQFWGTKMGLKQGEFNTEKLTSTKNDMEAWLRSRERLDETRTYLAEEKAISAEQRKALQCFERTFSTYLLDTDEATLTNKRAALCKLFVGPVGAITRSTQARVGPRHLHSAAAAG